MGVTAALILSLGTILVLCFLAATLLHHAVMLVLNIIGWEEDSDKGDERN